jgi:hypothetical protein
MSHMYAILDIKERLNEIEARVKNLEQDKALENGIIQENRIIQECAELIQSFVDRRIPASEYPRRLKQHFGVE